MLKNPCSYKKKSWGDKTPERVRGYERVRGSDLEGLDCIT